MELRIIKKTAIHKAFTAMIGFFLIALILFVAQRYWVAALCLAVFGVLFWKWRLLFSEELFLATLAQNAGQLRYAELNDRFSLKNVDETMARLIKKGVIRKEQDFVALVSQDQPDASEKSVEK